MVAVLIYEQDSDAFIIKIEPLFIEKYSNLEVFHKSKRDDTIEIINSKKASWHYNMAKTVDKEEIIPLKIE